MVSLSLYTESSWAVLEGMLECVVQAESRVTGSWTQKVLVLGFFHQLKPCDSLARCHTGGNQVKHIPLIISLFP